MRNGTPARRGALTIVALVLAASLATVHAGPASASGFSDADQWHYAVTVFG